jgi:hypothetical protein
MGFIDGEPDGGDFIFAPAAVDLTTAGIDGVAEFEIRGGLQDNRCRAGVVPVDLVVWDAGMNIGDFGEVADDIAILKQGHQDASLADIAIDEVCAIVVAGPAIEIEDAMSAVEKVTDDESSDPPTATGDCYAKRGWHRPAHEISFFCLEMR